MRLLKTFKRAVAVISDTHFGSAYGIFFPDKYKTSLNNIIKPNESQIELHKFWSYFWKQCDDWQVDTVIHLGDEIEGLNKKEYGDKLLFSSLDEQVDAFVDLMKPFVKGRLFLNVTGSKYHSSVEFKTSKIIAEKLNGRFLGFIRNITLKNVNRTINVAHSSGFPSIYLATLLDREALFLNASQSLNKVEKIDIILRGHIHLFLEQHQISKHCVFVPCWKVFEPSWLTTKLFARKIPDIGGVIIAFDKDNKIYVIPFIKEFKFDLLEVL